MTVLDCSAAVVEAQVTQRIHNTDRRYNKATLIGNWFEERSKYKRECFKHDTTYRQHYRMPAYGCFLCKRDKPAYDVKMSQDVNGDILTINPQQVNPYVTIYDLAYDRCVPHGAMERTKPWFRADRVPWNGEHRVNVCANRFATTRGILPIKASGWHYDKTFENPCAVYPSRTLYSCDFCPVNASEYRRTLELTKQCADRAYNNRPVRVLPRHLDGYAANDSGCRRVQVVPDVLVNLPPGCSVRAPTTTGCLDQSCAKRIDHYGLNCELSRFPVISN